MAKEYRTLPSELLRIADPYTGWCIDEAVFEWGSHVESELKEAARSGKDEKSSERAVKQAWRNLFGDEEEEAKTGGRFRDPVDAIGK